MEVNEIDHILNKKKVFIPYIIECNRRELIKKVIKLETKIEVLEKLLNEYAKENVFLKDTILAKGEK